MKNILFVMFLGLNSFAETTYPVNTKDATTVQVYASQLEAAYNNYIQSSGINTQIQNDDGTTSVVNPRIKYAGEYQRVQGNNGTNQASKDNLVGVCKALKLGEFTSVKSSWMYGTIVLLNTEGIVSEIQPSSGSAKIQADSITCKTN